MSTIIERFERGRLLFDGGIGSMLIAAGLETGRPPEEWNISRSRAVKSVHAAYLDAGAEVIQTNTFGGTRGRLTTHGLADRVDVVNMRGLELAREAVGESAARGQRFIAFSVGPGAELLPPLGVADEAQVGAAFREQFAALSDGDPPDLVLIETMLDLRVAMVALKEAKAATRAPVAVSMTYNRNPRGFYTVMGNEAAATTRELEAAGADVIAANCSIASADMRDLAPILRDATTLPVLCQPNAGSPAMRDGRPVYEQEPEEFVDHALQILEAGVNAVGGCCGTTPEFIHGLAEAMGGDRGV